MNNFLPPPFFRFPFSMHYPSYKFHQNSTPRETCNTQNIYNTNNSKNDKPCIPLNSSNCSSSSKEDSCKSNYKNSNNLDFLNFLPKTIGPLSFNPNGITDNKEPIFELLGIKLYIDDIIIIGILIFLYKQEVKDEGLYLVLIMLLFS